MFKSKTSLAGIGAIVSAIGAAITAGASGDGSFFANVPWEAVIPAILAGIGLIFSKSGKPSE